MILCADDYGYSTGVDKAILILSKKRRLTSVSVLTTHCQEASAKKLSELSSDIDIGLHINLTEGVSPLTFFSYSKLSSIVEKQLDRFFELFGKDPDYIDGHQHTQNYPLAAYAIRDVLEKRRTSFQYLRLSIMNKNRAEELIERKRYRLLAKEGAISICGIFSKPILSQTEILTDVFGHNSESELLEPFSETFQRDLPFLSPQNSLFYCHPSLEDEDLKNTDDIYQQRRNCFDFLDSESFVEILKENDLTLNRFKACPMP